ncbi:hypothetical protein CSTERTH_10885 [Thermoclostridium stercorarium subsp. thermolacticum DSM 2910]|jgi:ABC-type sugar transport system permease subunit|uniref:DUF2752 domain-containing protein n=2 Tax=Thermoclostridium stercorarium TaxID=1510 RepID=A0A1B1YN08_THEST|nr:DUF2752 domain-containing protein [Thermoclostridium stercorarium]AGI40192.1 hypothetical protein Clst_2166 [Thermoclostridium stercorarium subsp. stercorarium DSM 8532]ANW99496.1 hypothetical protein CSTERTH_10885 [Thermoclostridium stercorarium subsp. thermolacticum DSM 2910]ANX02122.1 hypothetical protein CSTERLE_11365 [Thermoclostridium stercorarium subsp. leptospartum DSM 9219]UZQ85192.1 DUF2752 domain-containing protein [Thermoclostridium stercorarium]
MNTIITISNKIHKKLKKWLTFFGKPFIRYIMLVLSCAVIITCCVIVYRIDPAKVPLTPPCSFRYFTGLYCPGCGMTRALHAALNLRFSDAFSYNLLWPLITMFVLMSVGMWFSFLVTGKCPFNPFNRFLKRYSAAAYVFIIVLFAFWILRNIPVYPFTLLAP